MASKALKGALGNMDIDKVDDMMADIQESQDVSNELPMPLLDQWDSR